MVYISLMTGGINDLIKPCSVPRRPGRENRRDGEAIIRDHAETRWAPFEVGARLGCGSDNALERVCVF